MPKRGELYNAMVNGSSSDALMLTCMHLYDQTTIIMEDDWIVFSALIGKTPEFAFGSLWNQLNKSILDFIDAEEVDAQDAMMRTVKLMLLYKRCATNNAKSQPLTINLLRQKVIHIFPEKAVLSAAGLIKYQPILSVLNDIKNSETSSESDVSLFCQRILAGLSKVMSENSYEDMRYSLEYLCKKKIEIPLPSKYPCPNMEEAERGEIIWFLWGAILCFYGDKNGSYKYNETTKDIVFTNYSLFVAHWKRISNKERLGLLWGVPYALNTNVSPDWTYTEKIILDKLDNNGKEIWRAYLQERLQTEQLNAQATQQNSGKKNKQAHQSQSTSLNTVYVHSIDEEVDILSTFIPRKTEYDDEDTIDTKIQNNNNLSQLQQKNHQHELEQQYTAHSIYDKQLENLEKTVPFVKTLYIDKNSKFTNSGLSKSTKKKDKQSDSSTLSQLETTELLIKKFDAKYF